jgi:hypothetical protein
MNWPSLNAISCSRPGSVHDQVTGEDVRPRRRVPEQRATRRAHCAQARRPRDSPNARQNQRPARAADCSAPDCTDARPGDGPAVVNGTVNGVIPWLKPAGVALIDGVVVGEGVQVQPAPVARRVAGQEPPCAGMELTRHHKKLRIHSSRQRIRPRDKLSKSSLTLTQG